MNALQICPPHLSDVATLHWENQKKVTFRHYYSYALEDKKLSYRRGTARCFLSVKILPTATPQCRNYLYDKS